MDHDYIDICIFFLLGCYVDQHNLYCANNKVTKIINQFVLFMVENYSGCDLQALNCYIPSDVERVDSE